MAGELFETFVVSEIAKSYLNAGSDTHTLFFYRDSNQKEIDLLISKGGLLYPVEIKKSAQPSVSMAKNFPAIRQLDNLQGGTILCQCERQLFLSDSVQCLPLEYV